MIKYVLDSSAILALIIDEPGEERVRAAARHAVVSAVNLAEVVAKLLDRNIAQTRIDATIDDLDFPVIAFSAEYAMVAGALRTTTRSPGLSSGDRACLALASRLKATAMTADRAWMEAEHGVSVELIR